VVNRDPSAPRNGARQALSSLFSRRFVEYGLVGLSGVFVNLGAFWLLAHVGGLHRNVASALAIELSILSNFALHDLWTFRDRKGQTGALGGRFARFQGVSLVGLLVQVSTFIACNVILYAALWPTAEVDAYFAGGEGAMSGLARALVDPPPVGRLDLISQLCGIALGTLWNFVLNNLWTWKAQADAETAS